MVNSLYFKETVREKEGLHIRPCDAISNISRINEGPVDFIINGRRTDAKDIFSLISQGIPYGTNIGVSIQITPHCLACSSLLHEALRDKDLTEHFQDYIARSKLI